MAEDKGFEPLRGCPQHSVAAADAHKPFGDLSGIPAPTVGYQLGDRQEVQQDAPVVESNATYALVVGQPPE
jgi:hypothetical protein